MIDVFDLSELLTEYGVDPKRVLKNNQKILSRGEYFGIKNMLDYLIGELNVSARNIEKCPSILYSDLFSVKENYNFLKNSVIKNKDVVSTLHMLGVDPNELKKTYEYVLNKYGKKCLSNITSILRVPVERIKAIESMLDDERLITSAAISSLSINDIEKDILICRENGVNIVRSVFKSSPRDLEDIVITCKKYGIKPEGTMFLRNAKELEKIFEICKENNIEPKGTIFLRSP